MAWQKLSALAVLGVVLLGAVAANEFEAPDVLHLDSQSYEELVSRGT